MSRCWKNNSGSKERNSLLPVASGTLTRFPCSMKLKWTWRLKRYSHNCPKKRPTLLAEKGHSPARLFR
jgi:hypothetical protein